MEKTKTFLALGDSYTIGESVPPEQSWPYQLVSELRRRRQAYHDPKIIATTGWRTDDLKNAIQREQPPHNFDLVSLSIGVNNQYQHKPIDKYKIEFEELLELAVGFAANKKQRVIVLSIPDYGYTPFGAEKQAQITKELAEYNHINKTITRNHGITYINITDISKRGLTEPELVASDGLHPSGKMYTLWVREILLGSSF